MHIKNNKNELIKQQIRFKNIRFDRYFYFMAYALELIFFALRGQFLPVRTKIFGINGWTIIQIFHMVSSLIVMLLWSNNFKKLTNIFSLICLIGFIPFIFLPIGYPRYIFCLIGYIGLGGVVTACRCGYAFACNNAERLFSMLLTYFSVMFIRLFRSQGFSGFIFTYLLPILLLIMLIYCLYQYKEEDFEVKEETNEDDVKGLYWAFAYFIIYFAIDGYIGELTDSSLQDQYLFLIFGILITGIILLTSFIKTKLNIWHLWNMFFIFSIGMGLFAILADKISSFNPMYFFSGCTYMGWPLCIYTLGCAQRKFASYKLLKKCTLIYVVLSPITTLSSDWIASFIPEYLPLATLCFTLVVTIIILMCSPLSYNELFTSIWVNELYDIDMKILKEKVEEVDKFYKYDLTPRQKEVAVLLLSAKTRRQIASELKLSESTIKMHTADLYKKLNINSKSELFKIFMSEDN